jgi:type IV secretion system protein VirB6
MTASLSSGLASVDCQLNTAVTVAYSRFFSHGGLFSVALTLMLTIYVAVVALRLMTGHTRLTLNAMTPRVLVLGLVLTFATAWPAYQTVVLDLLWHGPDQIASALLGNSAGATRAFAQRLDGIFDRFMTLAQALESKGQSGQLAARWVWASTLLLMLSTAGLMLVVKIVLAVLLALGPLFIVFALFDGTRGLFEGWLKTAAAFALAPLLIVIGGVGAMAILAPLTDSLLDDPASLATDLKPVFLLFMGTLIYAATLIALFWTAMSLARHWRMPFGRAASSAGAEDRSSVPNLQRMPAGTPAFPQNPASSAPASHAETDGRIASLLVSVSRNDAAAPRTMSASGGYSRSEAGTASTRTSGLGQAKSIKPHKRGFSGRVRA